MKKKACAIKKQEELLIMKCEQLTLMFFTCYGRAVNMQSSARHADNLCVRLQIHHVN